MQRRDFLIHDCFRQSFYHAGCGASLSDARGQNPAAAPIQPWTGYEDGNYSAIAGHPDGEEPVIDAMRREAREEAGIELVPDTTEIVGVMHWFVPRGERTDVFLTADKRGAEPRAGDV